MKRALYRASPSPWLIRLLAVGLAAAELAGCHSAAPGTRDILFQAQQPSGTEDIYALRLKDLSIRRIVSADTFSSRALSARSPDNRSIVFVREFGDSGHLYILDSPQGTPRRLASNLKGFFVFPDWSSNGRHVLFAAGSDPTHMAVYLVNADGSGLRAVLNDSLAYRCPSWAPDGQEVAVAAYVATRSQIMILDLRTGLRRTVLAPDTAYVDCPQWSPSGAQLLVTVYRGTAGLYEETPRPYGANLALLNLKNMQFDAVTDVQGLNNYGRWSPDGEWITFQSDRHVAKLPDSTGGPALFDSLEIYIVRPDGSDLRRLTRNAYFDAHPSW
jgi:Tol biopolymer transport system component